jgi:hypothetical protein
MTLPASGAISFNDINVELGVSGTTQASLNQASYRTLAGVPSGAISLSDFYGKANAFAFTISSNQTNANLRTLAVNAGWNQSTKVVATIGSGVQISSTSTGTPALTVNGSFPGGVELINSGVIVGRGGAGGSGSYVGGIGGAENAEPGAGGGTALAVSVALSLNNANTISGGGGGGGGGSLRDVYQTGQGGGGGGGGGNGFGPGGPGGFFDVNGSAGSTGGQLTGGSGGAGGEENGAVGGAGGAGGSNAASGSTGGDGNWSPGAGGAGGNAITGNSNITYIATGTRYGGIS